MRLRITKVDEYQFLTCVKNAVWGSKAARFNDWKVGDFLAITAEKAIAGLAEVAGEPYFSKKPVWDNGIFPHRIPLKLPMCFSLVIVTHYWAKFEMSSLPLGDQIMGGGFAINESLKVVPLR
ncbi:MAG: hypothetical protein A3F84_15285 [Candidatus Handelsmanbacteria bacterium RIFCSPLOWO2_12_FULL_64_10]|uniref:Uncharacterized protein n=1 Tax=Handelsmanbacteria sp. (strain RIFCSPLOWO2_12_FULL_64_10) TaxID=1817868 RepID=A0A1F6CS14_HANXR|nr:MAG: hypothetical protein A3F84_15285 [Candidatus Handelsmanbacteria bacterium RIFCSPLOWO2_12_FULL_64_10]